MIEKSDSDINFIETFFNCSNRLSTPMNQIKQAIGKSGINFVGLFQ